MVFFHQDFLELSFKKKLKNSFLTSVAFTMWKTGANSCRKLFPFSLCQIVKRRSLV